MGFSDCIGQADGITIALSCGKCGGPAVENHLCFVRYLRDAAVVRVRQLPDDLFQVQGESDKEEYIIDRATFERSYQPI